MGTPFKLQYFKTILVKFVKLEKLGEKEEKSNLFQERSTYSKPNKFSKRYLAELTSKGFLLKHKILSLLQSGNISNHSTSLILVFPCILSPFNDSHFSKIFSTQYLVIFLFFPFFFFILFFILFFFLFLLLFFLFFKKYNTYVNKFQISTIISNFFKFFNLKKLFKSKNKKIKKKKLKKKN